ncbi:hypothetical protein N7325_20900 [Stutzerimonas stutzeri]|uniref:hypothetical protein n=1 Tax=Stutzerimonas stutzeri TaxID=316 RepID=UPI00244D4231|nr:hypothetical protein [Stutzerimonas stutzeri]MDH0122272.1 hypothetical protein [Stutzerimonas stutzeri]
MMGRWMQQIQKRADAVPTKPTQPSFVSSVGSPSGDFEKKQAANDPLTPQQVGWLASVASLLEVATNHLVEGGFIDRHDLDEQLDAAPSEVARLIRSDPRWY